MMDWTVVLFRMVNKMKYSVLMSVYINDKAEYLKPCIESMLNQTAKPDQFVIVEDGKLASDCGKSLRIIRMVILNCLRL